MKSKATNRKTPAAEEQTPRQIDAEGSTAPAKARGRRKNVSREDWLYAGLLQFAEGGESQVRVERIARELGVTKGSYYWYFASREDFLEQLLQHSLIVGTEEFIELSETRQSPREKLRLLIAAILKDRRGKDFQFFLRDFARRNKLAAKILRQTEGRRIAYVTGLLRESGLDSLEAAARAEIFYNYYLGWYERNKDRPLNRKELERQLDWMARIVGVSLADD
ncbi:MAG: TetR/AcrR family transcriptional regulator [bacterium]|nr:TetR/AcrR family transcriptional regulator [bacterium]